ncbi:LacI family DNA-binding transcriptional regulator [Rivibacter subsaxonicus]|uniref:LacI family transcriptional regulator n=1 Tax=Rivibacter subsaxonicus TaxID=457575 RepID=A0A4Q7VZS5_9BURK|nr:LacI family DNA-binding transcriptional regulator [Rivibacter subsaxonicus]RZU02300.1 LacI family transcriptional regulator [Rivibacter subsaxonicus]
MAASVTITQIAEAAGVSSATVDRVLNNRPGVNPATTERVRDAMRQLGAGTPVRGRPRSVAGYRFAFVLPAARRGFFDQVDRVIAQAAGDFRHQHITETTRRLPAHDGAAFAEELARLGDLDGVALLAPDMPMVKLAINELVRSGVHVVTLFSDVAGSMRETFVGADNRAAGRTAGLLLGRSLGPAGEGRCALLAPATRYAAEIDRGIGFAQVLQERFPRCSLLRVDDMPESDEEVCRRTLEALAPNGVDAPVAAVYNVGPGSHGVHRALCQLAEQQAGGLPPMVAHDLLDVHRAMLVSGALSFVLQQDVHYAVTTAARVLRALCDGVRGALAVSNPRVEILSVENLA